MIVKNEEDVIGRCLECVSDIFDEIIVVDTGSDDKTKEIVKKYTKGLYYFKWIEDFAAARNFAFSKATKDYIMWLDADDIILDKDKEKIKELKMNMDKSIDMVMMKYYTSFDEAGRPSFSYFRERWIRNCAQFRWVGAVHEVIPPDGSILYSDIAVCHRKQNAGNPDRNLKIYQKLIADGKTLEPRHQYYYGRELYYHGQYQEAAAVLEHFLLEPEGWIENKIEACSVCAGCYYQMGQEQFALLTLLRSLSFDIPRAELCCEIGKHFLEHGNLRNAVYWYETALNTPKNESSGGFTLPDCYDYIPLLQLCVCHDRLGDRQKAAEYNERAGLCKPCSPAYLYNKQHFESL